MKIFVNELIEEEFKKMEDVFNDIDELEVFVYA